MQAGLIISGVNAEVMPGQWEFQIGPTGPLETGDQVGAVSWLAGQLGGRLLRGVTMSSALAARLGSGP